MVLIAQLRWVEAPGIRQPSYAELRSVPRLRVSLFGIVVLPRLALATALRAAIWPFGPNLRQNHTGAFGTWLHLQIFGAFSAKQPDASHLATASIFLAAFGGKVALRATCTQSLAF